ncbi:hypothetical protein OCU04_009993 [Sclerotinia nivalis]|uniref:Uncharacterized protein n=1 Tax=Sclerotinia nivalis TaxID=352851 RepID=A0A9X0AH89_9HELO|nr:hypothetical protein OCU04_009993 [Sclerotinia nivalis]
MGSGRQSTIRKAPSAMNAYVINFTATLNKSKDVAPSELDSEHSSQTATPDTLRSPADYLVTSGKTSLSQSLQKLKPKQLRAYKKPIPPLTWERFSDLREQYAESLYNFTRGLPGCFSVLMTLQVLGEDEETAEPCVFIQCDKAISKKVRNFFKQHVIKIDCEPPEPDDRLPRLRVSVCPFPQTSRKISSSYAAWSGLQCPLSRDLQNRPFKSHL